MSRGSGRGVSFRRGSRKTTRRNASRAIGAVAVAAGILVIIAIFVFSLMLKDSHSSDKAGDYHPVSTIARKHLDTSHPWIGDCVVDQLNWLEDSSKLEDQLKGFWEQTGVQPFIYLKAYGETINSEQARAQWAAEYYDEHFEQENVLLLVYFAESESGDQGSGFRQLYKGNEVSAVMDREALDIFTGYLDHYWNNYDLSWDKVFENTYGDTARTIMKVTKDKHNIAGWIIAGFAILFFLGAAVVVVLMRHNKPKDAETEDWIDEDDDYLE